MKEVMKQIFIETMKLAGIWAALMTIIIGGAYAIGKWQEKKDGSYITVDKTEDEEYFTV